MMGVRLIFATGLLIGVAGAAAATPADTRSPLQIVHAFTAARVSFDQQAVRELTDPGYVEISPLGELDGRDAVIGFYAPDKRAPGPSVAFQQEDVRDIGDRAAFVTLEMVYAMPPSAPQAEPIKRRMRAGFLLQHASAGWRLTFAQYTAVRERPAAPAVQGH